VLWSAVFRCVQVTSVDDGQREVAYQAAVRFRGLLYDLGAEEGRATSAAGRLGSSDLHPGSASSAAPDLYGGSAPLILGGLGYGNTL
jgi:LRP1 type putative zinc finger protein